jgi:hypothetical protein
MKRAVFISLPMKGRSDEEVRTDIEHAKEAYLAITGFDISQVAFVNNLDAANIPPEEIAPERLGVWYLGHAFSKLATCDEAFFWLGWKKAHGCLVEHEVCTIYGIPVLAVEGDRNA